MAGDLAAVQVELTAKAAEITAELDQITAESREASSGIGFGKRVGEGTSAAVDRLANVAVHERLSAMLADVQRASVKIDDGTYGVCDVCGTQIPAGRLEALPWAVVCVQHAR